MIAEKREDELRRRREASKKYYAKQQERKARGEIATLHHASQKRDALVRAKPDTCEVCGRGGRIVFDHCHNSTEFRGWICHSCNVALGHVNDDREILLKLVAYLDEHKQ